MQRVAYPYTITLCWCNEYLILIILFHSSLFLFTSVSWFCSGSKSEAVKIVPCSCGKRTRTNNVSDKKSSAHGTHGCVIVYSLWIELIASSIGASWLLLHYDVELTASRRGRTDSWLPLHFGTGLGAPASIGAERFEKGFLLLIKLLPRDISTKPYQ